MSFPITDTSNTTGSAGPQGSGWSASGSLDGTFGRAVFCSGSHSELLCLFYVGMNNIPSCGINVSRAHRISLGTVLHSLFQKGQDTVICPLLRLRCPRMPQVMELKKCTDVAGP